MRIHAWQPRDMIEQHVALEHCPAVDHFVGDRLAAEQTGAEFVRRGGRKPA